MTFEKNCENETPLRFEGAAPVRQICKYVLSHPIELLIMQPWFMACLNLCNLGSYCRREGYNDQTPEQIA